jgi:hypothetical protein
MPGKKQAKRAQRLKRTLQKQLLDLRKKLETTHDEDERERMKKEIAELEDNDIVMGDAEVSPDVTDSELFVSADHPVPSTETEAEQSTEQSTETKQSTETEQSTTSIDTDKLPKETILTVRRGGVWYVNRLVQPNLPFHWLSETRMSPDDIEARPDNIEARPDSKTMEGIWAANKNDGYEPRRIVAVASDVAYPDLLNPFAKFGENSTFNDKTYVCIEWSKDDGSTVRTWDTRSKLKTSLGRKKVTMTDLERIDTILQSETDIAARTDIHRVYLWDWMIYRFNLWQHLETAKILQKGENPIDKPEDFSTTINAAPPLNIRDEVVASKPEDLAGTPFSSRSRTSFSRGGTPFSSFSRAGTPYSEGTTPGYGSSALPPRYGSRARPEDEITDIRALLDELKFMVQGMVNLQLTKGATQKMNPIRSTVEVS